MIPGRISGKQHQAAEESFSGKLRAVERERCGDSKSQRDGHRAAATSRLLPHRFPDRTVGKERAIPVEVRSRGGKPSDSRSVERINNQHRDRQIQEMRTPRGMGQSAIAILELAAPLIEKLHFFSSRSERNSRATTSTSMQSEIAAPSGQL